MEPAQSTPEHLTERDIAERNVNEGNEPSEETEIGIINSAILNSSEDIRNPDGKTSGIYVSDKK